MKKTFSLLVASFFLCSLAFAAYKSIYNPETGAQDYVGTSKSADVTVVCDAGNVLTSSGSGVWACAPAATGSGDVTGPTGATAEDIVLFNGGTGKVIKDSGIKTTDLVTTASADVTYLKIASADVTYLQDAPSDGSTYGRKNAAWSVVTSNPGTVTNVSSAALPIVVTNGTTAPVISIQSADTVTDGYLKAVDWNTFNNKQPSGSYVTTASADATYLLLNNANQASWNPSTTVVTNLNADLLDGLQGADYMTGASADATYVRSVSVASAPLVKTGTVSPVISIVSADSVTSGYLKSTDWNTFNNKLSTASADATYVPYSGALSAVNLGAQNLTTSGLLKGGVISDDTVQITGGSIYSAKLGSLTTNGFVKTGSSNGTLSVDTNTYLTAESDTLQTVTGRGATTTISSTFPSITLNGTAGNGWLVIPSQSANPTSPAAGNVLLHATTTQGFTRLEGDNEATSNVIYGRDSVIIARNTSGADIAKGKSVYVTGSTGNVPNIALARSDSLTTLPTVGITLDDITNGSFGQVMMVGIISSIDTSAFATGAQLWVSTDVAGAFQSVRPSSPNYVQRIGSVLVSGIGNGSIMVDVAPFVGGMETGNAQLQTAGFVKTNSSGVYSVDTNTYVRSGDTVTFANITDSGLTITRVPFASTAGLLVDSANMTYSGTRLSPNYVTLAAGTTSAGTSPLKFTSGTSMTNAEAGAVEFTTDDYFATITTGTARKRLLMADPVGGLTSGRVPFATTNGRLTDSAGLTYSATAGLLVTGGTSTSSTFTSGAVGVVALIVKAFASQTADLQKWQDSSGNDVARMDINGTLYTGGSGQSSLLKGIIVNSGQGNATTDVFIVRSSADTNLIISDVSNDRVGVGLAAPIAKLHVLSTGEQLRLGSDFTNYFTTNVSSTGLVSFDAVGAGSLFRFADGVSVDRVANLATNGFVRTSGSNGTLSVGSVSASADVTLVCDSGKILKTTGSGNWACADEAGTFVDRGDPASPDYTISSFTTDGNWYDLDVSSIVPAGAKAVLFKVGVQDDVASSVFSLRKNGNSNATASTAVVTQVSGVTTSLVSIVPCDTNRVVEYQGSNTTFTIINVTVLGWWT